ncbi:hypothetical protein ABL78_8187 [Leptomonas seymouri]|uniref:BRCT domain-containing protein n=1 Tax=Leptomonas seymouri TaxID=5684 RepID=A0A0N1I0Y3_LEPSE|nr:hypothetical protein ABL78_8187 [Leptomonas seymouri]|eukprot:KPI82801.1 hypothetical protein ABL78_8187 [Leptomonas seymouri]
MDVPATRPEVTTTGIYGEDLSQMRQRLLRSDLSWCGDLTARTQVLIVGCATPIGSRKLAVARSRRLPCVSPTWVTEGACLLNSTDAFDICHTLSGKEVCTTSLNHLERGRVQAVCTTRCAKYNPLLTRQCGLLVAPTSALACTSPSASSWAATNDKIRFARKHDICTISVEEFALRYDVESMPKQDFSSSDSDNRVGRDHRQQLSLKGSSTLSEGSSHTRNGVHMEVKGDMNCGEGTGAGPSDNINAHDVLASRSVRCTALSVRSTPSTQWPNTTTVNALESHKVAAATHTLELEGNWRSSVGVALSAIQPTMPSQLTAIAATGTSRALSQSPRPLGDDFSDVVAYCSPPHRLTTEQHDLLFGMGVTITIQLTPFTTHVLILGDTVEECLYPRPGLQIVSWQWVSQSQLEQRRLSCAGFRVHPSFCPVITFTGLSVSDKHELVAALRHSGLPCEVQEAFVLGGAGANGGAVRKTSSPTSASMQPFLPRSTTHLISLRRQLLDSQKVAMLAQHCYQHVRQRPSFSSCRLIGIDWIYRSIQRGEWLDPELFTLAIPHPEAFALAAAHKTKTAEGTLSRCNHSQSRVAVHPTAATGPAPPTPSLRCPGRSHSRSEVVVVELEEEEGAALSQHNITATENDAVAPQHASLPLSSTPPPAVLPAVAAQKDEDDEEAGGKSPSATAAFHSALQVMHTSQPPLRPSQAERQPSTPPSGESGSNNSSSSNGYGASPPDSRTASLQHAAQIGTSHAYLSTQYSPSFEGLLGELEAYASAVQGGGVPFSSLGVAVRPLLTNALSLADKISDASHAQDAESVLNSPPTAVNGHEQQQQSVLQRASLHRQRLLRRQQQTSFLKGPSVSDESQVVFYQMEFGDHAAVASPSPGASQSNQQVSNTDTLLGSAITSNIPGNSVAVPSPSVVTMSTTAREGVAGPANPNTRSAATAAVFLITKDVLKGSGIDWDAFAAHFPHFQRTSKPEECTHFITAKPSKTEQFLCCLAAGRWILTPAYLSACAAAGYLVKEETFEWSAEIATMLGCRSSVASLVRGCVVQRLAPILPFARWQVQVCCASAERAESFLRVLRNGGCTSMQAVTSDEVLAAAKTGDASVQVEASTAEYKLVLADDTMFTEEKLEGYAQCSSPRHLCPILRLEYLVRYLCAPETLPSEMDLLHCVRLRKRSRTEP